MNITESIKFNKLQEENEILKKELAEKDKEIELMNEQCDGAIREILEQQLYKEDLEREQLVFYEGQLFYKGSIKKEIYDKLPSKDVK